MRLRHFMQGTSMISACLKSTCSLATLALAFAATGALADHDERNPNVTKIDPGDTVKVSRIPGSIYLRTQDDPDDLIWDRLPTYRTTLLPAPPVHPSVKLRFSNKVEEGKHLYFQVARSDERFYIRLRWKDASEDRDSTVDGFRDGVAVQYAINGVDTSYMMGTDPDNPVNIWYWRADQEQIENLAAGGFGSTTALPEQNVTGASAYITNEIIQDNQWHVVMSRPFSADDTDAEGSEYAVDFSRDRVPMGFAVWQGSDAERDGNKRVTHTWILLEPGVDDGADTDTQS
ncbi:MAG TPA: ethylbenzene dehydrogenase-related protein [Halomonas sp.]|nr:ethylbenzene dehydrogenase-related protein [Halomonas sp.]